MTTSNWFCLGTMVVSCGQRHLPSSPTTGVWIQLNYSFHSCAKRPR